MSILHEFVLLVVPAVLVLLMPHLLPVLCLVQLVYIFINLKRHKSAKHKAITKPIHKPVFITWFRASCMLLTIISILAVDFATVFPRRFAKTELMGVSVMDGGVGAVLFGMGVSSGLRDWGDAKRVGGEPIVKLFSKLVPVLALGLGRTFMIKLLGYQVPIILIMTQ